MTSNSLPTATSKRSIDDTENVQLEKDSHTLIDTFLPSTSTYHATPPKGLLTTPFCLPQILSGERTPFARGYSDVLQEAVNLHMEEFLSFIDGLNLAIVNSPPLRVVDLVGNILGFIPLDWAVIASIVLPIGAQLGMFALSKSLTDRYLGAANDRIFRPRGLAARICTTAATQKLLGLSNLPEEEGGWKGALNSVGREVGKLVLKVPIPATSRYIHKLAKTKPSMPHNLDAGASEEDKTKRRIMRRLDALEGAALPVSLNVPPPAKVEGFVNNMQAHSVKFDEGVAKDKEKRRAARLETLAEVEAKLAELEAKDSSKAGFFDRLAAKRAKDRRELLQRRIANAQLREKWETDEVLWLVVVDATHFARQGNLWNRRGGERD